MTEHAAEIIAFESANSLYPFSKRPHSGRLPLHISKVSGPSSQLDNDVPVSAASRASCQHCDATGERADEEREQALNQLLSEMDGFTPDEGIVFIAATNRADLLDPALMRAGRFDRKVRINRPDTNGRLAILQACLPRCYP